MASRALFRSSGAVACAIGRATRRTPVAEGAGPLVVQLGDIGDLVLTSPFLRELHLASGSNGGGITLVVKPTVYPLAELCPYASRILAFDARRTRIAGALSGLLNARRFANTTLTSEYDVAWNPRFDLDELGATFLMHYSGAPKRIGYSEHVSLSKAQRNHGYDCILTRPVVPMPGMSRHEADRLLGLLEAEGFPVTDRRLELWLESKDETDAHEFLALAGSRMPIALGIGAGHPKRCWPPDRFARVAEYLYREHGAIAVLLGGPAERSAAAQISGASQVPVVDAVGHLSLRATAALIRRCLLYVGNDSGILHVSAASGIPVLEISCHPVGGDLEHPNSPERFGPYRVPSVILQPAHPASAACVVGCDADGPHCIEGIAVNEVLDGISTLFRHAKGTSP